MTDDTIILIANPLVTYSKGDRDAYFEWLSRNPCVQSHKTHGENIEIVVLKSKLDEENLVELIALFERFEQRMEELRVLETSQNRAWFRNKDAFWYDAVFIDK